MNTTNATINHNLLALSGPGYRFVFCLYKESGHLKILKMLSPQLLRRNKQGKSPQERCSWGLWSEWGDSNARSLEPKSSAIPPSLHPDIQFLLLYHGSGENQSFSCLWSILWSKPFFGLFSQPVKIP